MLGAAGIVEHGPMAATVAQALAAIAGILLFLGLWTPVVGMVVAATELWIVLLSPQGLGIHVLQAVLAIGLAMIGHGVWSLDTRLYGWRRVEMPSRKS